MRYGVAPYLQSDEGRGTWKWLMIIFQRRQCHLYVKLLRLPINFTDNLEGVQLAQL